MRTRTELDKAALTGLINAAVDRGIIDAAQGGKLEALAVELAPSLSAPERQEPSPASTSSAREARRGFNAITIAYSAGALFVLFALAWFLFERWKVLRPAGVLGVALLYAAAFATVGVLLRRRGFDTAGGLAIVLAVTMTPVWTWAILRLTGEMPDPSAWDNALARYDPYVASRLVVMDLATIGVALAMLRRVRFVALAAPIAVALIAFLVHVGQALGDPRLTWYVGPYYQCVVACVLLAVAYAVERRQGDGPDYAFWFYLAGVVMVFVAYSQVWPYIGRWRHGITLVAVAFVTASLYLRRRTLLIGGGLMAFAYLGYLAFDVFRRVIALPITLATLGLLVIVATVWMQRRFPALVERVGQDAAASRTLPTGPIAVLGPLAIAITAMIFAGSEARERTAEREWRDSIYRRRARHEARAAKRTQSAVAPATPDTIR
jgi:hypothetical protein